jgi:hypothetical protein
MVEGTLSPMLIAGGLDGNLDLVDLESPVREGALEKMKVGLDILAYGGGFRDDPGCDTRNSRLGTDLQLTQMRGVQLHTDPTRSAVHNDAELLRYETTELLGRVGGNRRRRAAGSGDL